MEASTLIESFRVDGKVAVVTGAGSGIGRASALALAGAGAVVVCADILAETARATADEISANGGVATKLKMLAIEGAVVNHTPNLFD